MAQLLLFDTISTLIPTPLDIEQDALCPAYDAVPLGDDAVRFGQLLDELKGNEAAFYQGQMSNMALEYLETRDDDTVRGIIGSLQGEKTSAAGDSKNNEKIWQARLLLKLAEILRREEQEVQGSLQRIKDAQKEMLGDLKGEDEFQDLFHALSDALPNQTPVRIESLIKGWGQLFTAGKEHFSILHCFSPEAAEPFMEISESMTGKRPIRLLRLPLPDCGNAPGEFMPKREAWLEKNKSWLAELKTALLTIIEKGAEAADLAALTQLAARWTSQVDQAELWPPMQPGKDCGPPALELYLLGAEAKPLTAKLCNTTSQENHGQYSLLAVISSRPNSCN